MEASQFAVSKLAFNNANKLLRPLRCQLWGFFPQRDKCLMKKPNQQRSLTSNAAEAPLVEATVKTKLVYRVHNLTNSTKPETNASYLAALVKRLTEEGGINGTKGERTLVAH